MARWLLCGVPLITLAAVLASQGRPKPWESFGTEPVVHVADFESLEVSFSSGCWIDRAFAYSIDQAGVLDWKSGVDVPGPMGQELVATPEQVREVLSLIHGWKFVVKSRYLDGLDDPWVIGAFGPTMILRAEGKQWTVYPERNDVVRPDELRRSIEQLLGIESWTVPMMQEDEL